MPAENTTPRLGLRVPTSANNGSNFAQGIADMATDVDNLLPLQDTGWLDITSFGTGVAAGATLSGFEPSARVVGDVLRLRGALVLTGTLGATAAWATLPVGTHPPLNRSTAAIIINSTPVRTPVQMTINASGVIALLISVTSQKLLLDGIFISVA